MEAIRFRRRSATAWIWLMVPMLVLGLMLFGLSVRQRAERSKVAVDRVVKPVKRNMPSQEPYVPVVYMRSV